MHWKPLLILLILYQTSSCIFWGEICNEKVIKEYPSPSREMLAVTFEQNCGATTSVYTHINIRPANEGFQKESSGVIRQGRIFSIRGGAEEVKLQWTSPTNITIFCKNCEQNKHEANDYRDGIFVRVLVMNE
jgi:hypothetical protein